MTLNRFPSTRRGRNGRNNGFTLIELMIVVAIVGILVAIAYPSYVNSITKSKRKAATACLSNYATHMERFYTTNMRYDKDSSGADIVLPSLECAAAQNSGSDYVFGFSVPATASTYELQATPIGAQAARDPACDGLTLDHTGRKGLASTATGTVEKCW